MDGMICLSYRDAAPKTVAHGVQVGLPVFYVDSGGLPELVGDFGIAIEDSSNLDIEENVPDLSLDDMLRSYQIYVEKFDQFGSHLNRFDEMLNGYFRSFSSI